MLPFPSLCFLESALRSLPQRNGPGFGFQQIHPVSGAQVGVIYSQEAPGHTGQKSFDSLILVRGREAEACVL